LTGVSCGATLVTDQEGYAFGPWRSRPWSRFLLGARVWLLYADESGEPTSRYFVLAGVAAFEDDTYHISEKLNKLHVRYLPSHTESVEFHASAIRAGRRAPWDALPREVRFHLLDDVYDVIQNSRLVLFAVAVERARLSADQNAYEYALASLIKRFDTFLGRKYRDEHDPQRGLCIIAESQYRQRLEVLAQLIRREGTQWGATYNLAEVPLFTPAATSRLLQVADFCANAIWGRYESGQTRHFDTIASRFYTADKVVHGLFHQSSDHHTCPCPGCLTRRLAAPSEPAP